MKFRNKIYPAFLFPFSIYLNRFNNFGMDLYFECDFHEENIQANYKIMFF